jgi:hypothetical protein
MVSESGPLRVSFLRSEESGCYFGGFSQLVGYWTVPASHGKSWFSEVRYSNVLSKLVTRMQLLLPGVSGQQ